SALDIAGSAVIWGGLKFASRPPDETHPYGHGKAEPMAAGIVAMGVILAAIGLAIQSVREILTPHHGPAPFTLIVLIVVIAVNEWRLLMPAFYEMLDTAPRGEIVSKIQKTAASVAGVENVEKCLVRKMGISFYVDLHVGVDGGISVRDRHDIAHHVKDAIKQTDARIADVLVHVEPAL